MKNLIAEFENESKERIESYTSNLPLKKASYDFLVAATPAKYSYNFTWLGRPIIQYPQDIIAIQELIFKVKPDLIIETGVAHGGSLIFHASICEMLGHGKVVGIDIDIRAHNKEEIEKHPMFKRIHLIQGSSVDPKIVSEVTEIAKGVQKVMVILDSNHTHEHVYNELLAYAHLVTKDSYLIVLDTMIEDLPDELFNDRAWGKGNNPKTAINEFMKTNNEFKVDQEIENKLMFTVGPGGYLLKIK